MGGCCFFLSFCALAPHARTLQHTDSPAHVRGMCVSPAPSSPPPLFPFPRISSTQMAHRGWGAFCFFWLDAHPKTESLRKEARLADGGKSGKGQKRVEGDRLSLPIRAADCLPDDAGSWIDMTGAAFPFVLFFSFLFSAAKMLRAMPRVGPEIRIVRVHAIRP